LPDNRFDGKTLERVLAVDLGEPVDLPPLSPEEEAEYERKLDDIERAHSEAYARLWCLYAG
jgi:hypothetical protein